MDNEPVKAEEAFAVVSDVAGVRIERLHTLQSSAQAQCKLMNEYAFTYGPWRVIPVTISPRESE